MGAAYAVGVAAVPVDTTNATRNVGTIETCNIQGLFIYVSSLSAIFYFVSLSINCSESTSRRFQKYVHFGVHVYPIVSGIYLATLFEAFNNAGSGSCFIENDPIGCDGTGGNGDGVPCERGTDSRRTAWLVELLWVVPLYLAAIVPTVILFRLYRWFRRHESRSPIPATSVAKQAILYLLVLYAGILPWAVVRTLRWSDLPSAATVFVLDLFAEAMFGLFGLLSTLGYFYVTGGGGADDEDDGIASHHDTGMAEFIFEPSERTTPDDSADLPPASPKADNPKKISSTSNDITVKTNTSVTTTTHHHNKNGPETAPRRKSKRRSSRPSFNIFDGTNASGLFADFIYDGDSSDELNDRRETEKWDAVQDHI